MMVPCDRLSFTPFHSTQRKARGPISSLSPVGLGEKPTELRVARNGKLRFAGRRRGKLEVGPRRGSPRSHCLSWYTQVNYSVLPKNPVWEGPRTAAASHQRRLFSCTLRKFCFYFLSFSRRWNYMDISLMPPFKDMFKVNSSPRGSCSLFLRRGLGFGKHLSLLHHIGPLNNVNGQMNMLFWRQETLTLVLDPSREISHKISASHISHLSKWSDNSCLARLGYRQGERAANTGFWRSKYTSRT